MSVSDPEIRVGVDDPDGHPDSIVDDFDREDDDWTDRVRFDYREDDDTVVIEAANETAANACYEWLEDTNDYYRTEFTSAQLEVDATRQLAREVYDAIQALHQDPFEVGLSVADEFTVRAEDMQEAAAFLESRVDTGDLRGPAINEVAERDPDAVSEGEIDYDQIARHDLDVDGRVFTFTASAMLVDEYTGDDSGHVSHKVRSAGVDVGDFETAPYHAYIDYLGARDADGDSDASQAAAADKDAEDGREEVA